MNKRIVLNLDEQQSFALHLLERLTNRAGPGAAWEAVKRGLENVDACTGRSCIDASVLCWDVNRDRRLIRQSLYCPSTLDHSEMAFVNTVHACEGLGARGFWAAIISSAPGELHPLLREGLQLFDEHSSQIWRVAEGLESYADLPVELRMLPTSISESEAAE